MERNIIRSLIDRNPMLHAKRTGSYLKYVEKFWDTVFDISFRDIDQFRMYLADKSRCDLSKREQAYAERCREITNSIYAALVTFKKHGMLGNRLQNLICRRCGAVLYQCVAEPHKFPPAK